ncbi:ThuA domain-containing protein [bacterium]|nr:ThuA domain-containing protein [bacterium]
MRTIAARFTSLFVFLILVGLYLSMVYCSQAAPRILILTGSNNHDWRSTTEALIKLYQNNGFPSVTVLQDPQALAEKLASCDVLVSNWNSWPEVTGRPWGAKSEEAFITFIRQGGGLVLLHAASATLQDWPEFQRMAGATWQLGRTGHGRIHSFQVVMADTLHPVTQGLAAFDITDELWHHMALQPDIHVLCRAFSAPEHKGSGQYEPVALVTHFGKGRCFYSVLGHDVQAMSSPGWQKLMLRGTEWAATGRVELCK